MSVTGLKYDEKFGVLTVIYSNGAESNYFLVPPKVYEKNYDYGGNLDKFVSRCLAGQFPKSDSVQNQSAQSEKP